MLNNADHKFRPRGIEKWHAFAAVVAGDEQKEAAIEIEQISFEHFDEYYDELNYLIEEAISENKFVEITYLENNQYKKHHSQIKKVDNLNASLILTDKKIALTNIYKIEIL
jgi:hypothetical protein